jgi:rubrerythrin
MPSLRKKSSYKSHFQTVREKYKGLCPECNCRLIFAEASFFCPNCGFSEKDFVLEREDEDEI